MRMILGLLSLAAISCDASPPTPPATPVTEVSRVPLTGVESAVTPQVVSISPNGSRVAVRVRGADTVDQLKVYDTATQQWIESSIPVPADERLDAIFFSPNGRYEARLFLLPRLHRALRVHRLADAHECFALETDGYRLTPIAFSADGQSMLRPDPPARGKPFSFVIVDPDDGAVNSTLNVNLRLLTYGMFQRMAFTPDGKWVYGHQADRVLIWNVATGQMVSEWHWTGTGAVAAIGCTPDSRIVRALMQEGSVADLHLSTPAKVSVDRLSVPKLDHREPRMIPFEKPWSFNRAGFSSDAAQVLRDGGGRIDVYDVQSGALTRAFTLPAGATQVNFDARQGDLVPVHVRLDSGDAIAVVRLPR